MNVSGLCVVSGTAVLNTTYNPLHCDVKFGGSGSVGNGSGSAMNDSLNE